MGCLTGATSMEIGFFLLLTAIIVLSMSANAATAAQATKLQFPGNRNTIPALTGKTFYMGTLVFVTAAGYATDVIAAGVNVFGGIVADRNYDNSAGASGAIQVEVYTRGRATLTGSGFTQAHQEAKCYATDNYTVTVTATNNTFIGIIKRVNSSTEVEVEMATGNRTP